MNITLPLIAAASFVLLAWLEYFICSKAKNPSTQKLMFFLPFFIFMAAVLVWGSDAGGFMDMRNFVTAIIAIYGLLCLIAVFAGWLIYQVKHMPQSPQSCPYSEQE